MPHVEIHNIDVILVEENQAEDRAEPLATTWIYG